MSLWQRLASVPLRYKLLGGLIVTALVAIMIVVYSLAQYNQAIPSTTTELLRQLAQERHRQVSTAFDDVTSVLTQVATSQSNILNFALLNASPGSPASTTKLQEAFRLVLNTKPSIRQIRFTSLAGRVLASLPVLGSDDDTGQEFYQALHNRLPSSAANGNSAPIAIRTEKRFDLQAGLLCPANPATIAAISAAILMVLAISSRPTMPYSTDRGNTAFTFAASPRPVMQPRRALTIWMPTIRGYVNSTVHSML